MGLKNWYLFIFLSIYTLLSGAFAANIENLKNDKEVVITTFNKNEQQRVSAKFKDSKVNSKIKEVFYKSVENFLESENLKCEFRLMNYFEYGLYEAGLAYEPADVSDSLKLLRVNNDIDDVLYDLLAGLKDDYFGLRAPIKSVKPIGMSSKDLLSFNKLEDL